MMYDAIVLGVGAMGSAACYHLAKQGQKILGVEQFSVGHDFGSSHGETRIIRRAYYEHPDYVPLLNRAYELWKDLEKEVGLKIMTQNGLVTYADPHGSEIYRGTLTSARQYHIPIEEMSRSQAAHRFPFFTPPKNCGAIFESDAGFLRVEMAVKAHADMAKKRGAVIVEGEKVLGYKATSGEVTLETDQGSYRAKKLIVTGGGWTSSILGDLKLPVKIHRLIQYWFEASQDYQLEKNVPCFVFHLENNFYYGFPMLDGKR